MHETQMAAALLAFTFLFLLLKLRWQYFKCVSQLILQLFQLDVSNKNVKFPNLKAPPTEI